MRCLEQQDNAMLPVVVVQNKSSLSPWLSFCIRHDKIQFTDQKKVMFQSGEVHSLSKLSSGTCQEKLGQKESEA